MESAFSWFGDIIAWFGQLIPRIIIIRATHGGVKFVRGHKVVVLEPGLTWYWPIITEYIDIIVVRQTKKFYCTLETKDDKTIMVGVVIAYSIINVKKALVGNHDIDDTIEDFGSTIVASIITDNTLEQIRNEFDSKIKEHLLTHMKEELKCFGVKIEKAAISDFSRCFVVRRIENTPPNIED